MTSIEPRTIENPRAIELPGRAGVCLQCRSALEAGERCDGGRRHTAVSLATGEGREQLLQEVWGPPSVRRRARELAKSSGAGAATGSLLEACPVDCVDCSVGSGDLGPLAVIIACALIAAGIYYLTVKIIEAVRRRRNAPRPLGASNSPRPPLRARVRGRVVPLAREAGPATRGSPLGFGLVLRSKRFLRSEVMLRDGSSAGFEIVGADGQRAIIPAGRLWVEGPATRELPAERQAVEGYLGTLDPQHGSDSDLDPFPHDRAAVLPILEGDRVEAIGDFEARALEGAGAGPYREAPPTALWPRGVALVRILDRGARSPGV